MSGIFLVHPLLRVNRPINWRKAFVSFFSVDPASASSASARRATGLCVSSRYACPPRYVLDLSNGIDLQFADVSYATRALNDLYGATLNGLVKGGGIRLSYSKNPLGVRTPTNASNGTNTPATDGSVPIKSLAELDTSVRSRRDGSGMVSPTSSYQFSMSPPPPRFVSPPPVNASFGPGAFPRSMGAQSFGMASPTGSMSPSSSTPTFSPFGISPSPQLNPIGNNHLTTIPEQSNTFNNHNHASSYISDPEQHSSANAMSALSHDSS